jgi:hypothetical protein
MRTDQRGVQIDDHRATGRDRQPMAPHRASRPTTRPTDRRDRTERVISQGVDQPADRGIGGHTAEQLRLRTQHCGIGQTVTAQRDGDRQIQHHLARIVHRPCRPPRTQPLRQTRRQPADLRSLQ